MAEEMRTCKACGGTKPLEKGFNAVPRKEGGSIITNRAKPAATRQSGKSARRREPAR
ncbi:hypothetical protein F9Z35_1392 [Neisseria gonorrhoeae]|nr:hypothetical protein F9Z35_1392 [Neisseria gonorrhoeae]